LASVELRAAIPWGATASTLFHLLPAWAALSRGQFMEKRVFLAIFLSFVVLAIYQAYFTPRPRPRPAQDTVPPPAAASGSQPGAVETTGRGASRATLPAAAPAPAPAPVIAAAEVEDVVVESNDVRAVFSTEGGTLRSWRLKGYRDERGEPLELVPTEIPAELARPFTLMTDDPAVSAVLRAAPFQPSAKALTLGPAPGTLMFSYRDASGLNAHKAFHFQPEGKRFVVSVEAAVDVKGVSLPIKLAWGPALGAGHRADGSQTIPVRAVQFREGRVERLPADDLSTQPNYEGALRFAGVEEHYFLTAALPGTTAVRVDYQPISLPIPRDREGRTRAFVAYSVRLPGAASLAFFMGPKDFDVLRAADPELVLVIDFGIFRWLVVPLLDALKWINRFVGNFGWSIIILTVLLNLAIFPLRHKSMVSMRKMQALQPEIKSIQDRYAKYKLTDPERQKMNQEMMALYKQKGVNPASGCVPMLLTMPVLFAFYAMLSAAIELRGAPFFGWIHDLSVRDPFYVWPIVMGGTMVWQQRMMPASADPVQRKLFMWMPVIFTTMFLWAPSGLVIYWLMSNLMAIGQQYLTNRLIGGPLPSATHQKKGERVRG
jgi:YidC/Oxa1 family membrane protein insertase